MTKALQDGAENESVLFTVLTGVGNTYSSGTDIFDSDVDLEKRLIAT